MLLLGENEDHGHITIPLGRLTNALRIRKNLVCIFDHATSQQYPWARKQQHCASRLPAEQGSSYGDQPKRSSHYMCCKGLARNHHHLLRLCISIVKRRMANTLCLRYQLRGKATIPRFRGHSAVMTASEGKYLMYSIKTVDSLWTISTILLSTYPTM